MSNSHIVAGKHGVYQQQLAAGVVDVVMVDEIVNVERRAEVWVDGTAAVYFTTDGSTPIVGDGGSWEIPAGAQLRDELTISGDGLRLISAGTPKYSVTLSP